MQDVWREIQKYSVIIILAFQGMNIISILKRRGRGRWDPQATHLLLSSVPKMTTQHEDNHGEHKLHFLNFDQMTPRGRQLWSSKQWAGAVSFYFKFYFLFSPGWPNDNIFQRVSKNVFRHNEKKMCRFQLKYTFGGARNRTWVYSELNNKRSTTNCTHHYTTPP